jgi:hypothetical protein
MNPETCPECNRLWEQTSEATRSVYRLEKRISSLHEDRDLVKALLAKLDHLVQEQTQIGRALIEHEAQAHPMRYPAQRERRQARRRISINLAAHYWDGTSAASHIVRDVSTGGAFVFADFKWPPGTILTMILQLEGQVASGTPLAALPLPTRVVRCTPHGFGVQFMCSSIAERQRLEDFLKRASRSPDL